VSVKNNICQFLADIMWIVVIENIYLRREELISPNQYVGDFIDKHVVLCPAALLDNVYSE